MRSKNRWGTLAEIDYRTKVGSPAWYANHTRKLQKLSAWRRLHTLGAHDLVSASTGYSPSSNMPLTRMLKRVRNAEALSSLGFTNSE